MTGVPQLSPQTALARYQRLECSAFWREGTDMPRQEVIVSFGAASLVISDMRGQALTHWSLAAITPRDAHGDAGHGARTYAPGPDSAETLVMSDPTMIDAIGEIQARIAQGHRRSGAWTRPVKWGLAAALVAALLVWLPGALVSQSARLVPPPVRADIGAALLDLIAGPDHPNCGASPAAQPLARLMRAALPQQDATLVVVTRGIADSAYLPGGYFLIHRDLILGQDSPRRAVDALTRERAKAHQADPLVGFLSHVGPAAQLHLLTQGTLSPDALQNALPGYLAELTKATPDGQPPTVGAPGQDGQPVINDTDWVRLQSACAS